MEKKFQQLEEYVMHVNIISKFYFGCLLSNLVNIAFLLRVLRCFERDASCGGCRFTLRRIELFLEDFKIVSRTWQLFYKKSRSFERALINIEDIFRDLFITVWQFVELNKKV